MMGSSGEVGAFGPHDIASFIVLTGALLVLEPRYRMTAPRRPTEDMSFGTEGRSLVGSAP